MSAQSRVCWALQRVHYHVLHPSAKSGCWRTYEPAGPYEHFGLSKAGRSLEEGPQLDEASSTRAGEATEGVYALSHGSLRLKYTGQPSLSTCPALQTRRPLFWYGK